MNFYLILYSFILGLINHNILSKLPLLSFFGKSINLTFIIAIDLITFIVLEIILYKKTTLKESVIVSLVRIVSWFLGYLVDYLIISPIYEEVFNNTAFTILQMITLRINLFLIATSSLTGIIISANKEDKWNEYKRQKEKPSN